MKQEQIRKYAEVCNNAKKIAIISLKNFFNNLGIDSSLFDHIYNCPLKIGKTYNNAPAQYNSNNFCIIFNKNYLNTMIGEIENNQNNNKVYTNIALTLVHEMIHPNRAVMIEGGLNPLSIYQIINDEILKYDQKKKGHDLEHYNLLLNNILSKSYAKNFKNFIPIKIVMNDNFTYTIIAYNKTTKNYEQFKNQIFIVSNKVGIDEFIKKIEDELNDGTHMPDEIIYNFTKINRKKPKLMIASDYYHQFNSSLITEEEIALNMSLKEFSNLLNKKINYILDRIENQESFEEIITETIANIIIMTRNDSFLDLNKITYKLETIDTELDVKVGAKFIRMMGLDMLKWFMTSAYNMNYNDKMYYTFQERYDNLLSNFYNLYNSSINEENMDEDSINDIFNIIEEKRNKSK